MNRFKQPTSDQTVLWAKVWGLALMQGAIALMWVIYNLYVVTLLTQLGFSTAIATGLLVVENGLAMVMEPLMGSLSDRLQQRLGTQFPLISLGVILAAGTFISLPVIGLKGIDTAIRWVLPLMMVAWALTMTVFRSPALSLLGRYAFGTRLPQAASILTLVGGVAGAMGPLASDQILSWGPLAAFGLGSGVLILATLVLRLTGAPATGVMTPPEVPATSVFAAVRWASLGYIFGAGVGVTLGFRSLLLLFSQVVENRLPNGQTSLILGSIFVALAITAIPAGWLAGRWGNRRAMVIGLALLAFVAAAVGIAQNSGMAIALALLFGAAFSLVSNGTIPFALSMVPAPKAGLGTGMFFSGGAAASSLFGSMVAVLKTLPLGITVLLGGAALLLAGVCITCAPKRGLSGH
jgi:Na+/melibiose symporter-like transporter